MKDNKFFTLYGIITAIAVLGSGFFFFKSWSGDKKQFAEYQETADKVGFLKKNKLFPNSANLEDKKAQVAEYLEKSEALRKKLIEAQRDLKDIPQQDFPNILLSTFNKTSDTAKSKGVTLPENFYLGMEIYKDGLPLTPAVPVLEWQLDGINTFVNILLESGISAIEKLDRERLDVELRDTEKDKEKNRGNNSNSAGSGGKGADIAYEPEAVIDAHRFTITFESEHEAFVAALNKISNDPSFFYWVRAMRVENEKKEGPLRGEAFVPEPAPLLNEGAAAPAAAPEPAPEEVVDPAAAPEEGAPVGEVPEELVDEIAAIEDVAVFNPAMIDVREIFGTEKIKAQLIVDIVRFKAKEETKEGEGQERGR